ncbi:MAG: PorP/SprF family type IX secretion system membrane protein [Flavobacteriales bacterium]|nr:PorP/SprF family type IX secretion system membrane protein [Flavobacteriales bacterium]MBK6944367.1 PorP/SprF family type IX secretion system membrane protein [Flavobacteriales bacterium]MBK7242088.1 PorP/SprF family type IX secretion system membrane protein [Flavobacteriales bacterium]MBK9534035.1 PorP/SprF family type IX secretion system membrane protein [Flavobacteriales bacterium]MBP9137497.1 PorP/SprF family type IX secretion system membrane protein [Flavobacteriales bacterium]
MKNLKTQLAVALAICAGTTNFAQDAHLSQYETAPNTLNPALTGMYENADFRMTSNVRSQWNSLSSSFLTTGFAYDVSLQRRFGVGLSMVNYNMAGIMNTFQLGADGAYNVSDPKAKHTLSVGVHLGLLYKKMNDQQLLWDAQYNDGYFNSDLPSGEFMQRGSRWMPDVSAGIAYRSTNSRKSVNPFGNFAMFHVTTPDESVLRTTKSDLPIRFSVNAGARVEVATGIFVIPVGLYMRQGNDQQINAGMMSEIGIAGTPYSAVVGCSYRVRDAVIAQVGLKHSNAAFRFSYDINVSPLRNYTRKNGAFEFSILYYGSHSGRTRRVTSSAF